MIALINRIFIMVLLLSISGFVFSFIYLLLEKWLYKLTSAKFMVMINTIALLSFVIPFYHIHSLYDKSSSYYADYSVVVFEKGSESDRIITNIHYLFENFIQYIDVFWLIGMMIFLLINSVNYIRLIQSIKQKSFSIESDIWINHFETLKCEFQLKEVYLVANTTTGTPCTIGFFKKYIIIPTTMINLFDEEEIHFILKHEFHHIISDDFLRKFIIMILNSINWFNPLFYILRDNLAKWIEAYCDEAVTEHFKKQQKQKYCRLMLKVLDMGISTHHIYYYIVGFRGNEMKNHKRRIERIMNSNKKRKGNAGKILVSSAMMIAMFTSNAMAKEADSVVNKIFSENADVVSEANVISYEEYERKSNKDIIELKSVDFNSENYKQFYAEENADTAYTIIYADGSVSNDFGVNVEPRHTHTTVEVVISEHKKLSDGSCKTTYYEGLKCTVCGTVWKGDIIKTVTENPCTH